MAGFLEDYDIDLDNFNESGGFDVPDGTYTFELTNSERREGTSSDEDAVHIVLSFTLENEDGESYSWNWWLKVPDDPSHPTRRESISMSDWKKFLLGAGIPKNRINKAGPSDIEGITGTVQLVTTAQRKSGKEYQNPKNWSFDGVKEEEEKPAKKATKKSKPEPEEDEQPAKKSTKTSSAKKGGNPFASKK